MAKVKVNISVDTETAERLKQYAAKNHTNVSQAIVKWIWSEVIEEEKKDESMS